jgi:hypothetical protein
VGTLHVHHSSLHWLSLSLSLHWPSHSHWLSTGSLSLTVSPLSAQAQWGGKGGQGHATSIPHNNQTGRWVLPFRAVWAPGSDGVLVGSMKRAWDLFEPTSGKLITGRCPPVALRHPSLCSNSLSAFVAIGMRSRVWRC